MDAPRQEHIVDTQDLAADKNDVNSEVQVANIQNQEIDGEKHENVDNENNESEIFNLDQVVKYSSDEDSGEDDSASSNSDSDSDSDSSSGSSSDSDSNSDDEDVEDLQSKVRNAEDDDDEINENDSDEPIISKNEILDFKVPSLPENYLITEETNIQYIGNISGIVEKNVMIKGSQSAEEKVLKEGTIFCFEDRTPLGLMYEVFGRLQTPVYTVKFNSQEDADKFKGRKGDKIFYVVPSAEFLLTQQIKNIKGTDASNCNDEEIPEDEQEFSDDEKEAVAKKNKKRKKKQTNMGPVAETVDTIDGMEATNLVTNVNNNNSQGQFKRAKKDDFKVRQSGEVPISVKARLTSLPSKTKPATFASDITLSQKQQQQQQQQQHQQSQLQHQQQAMDPMVMMQNFMSMVQKASGLSQQQNSNFYQNPSSNQHQYGQQQQYNQYGQYNQQNQQNQQNQPYSGQFNGQFNHQYSGYNQKFNHQSYGQQNFAYNHQFNQQSYQQHSLPQSASGQLPVSGGNSNGNTALLVAQLAAAISKNALNSATNLDQSNFNSAQNNSNVGNENNKYEESDEYDPAA